MPEKPTLKPCPKCGNIQIGMMCVPTVPTPTSVPRRFLGAVHQAYCLKCPIDLPARGQMVTFDEAVRSWNSA